MQNDQFADIIEEQLRVCKDVMVDKAREYATDTDPLHNFHVAAVLEGTTMRGALAGMMGKHTVSVYDMCASDENYDLDRWNEKITDHINYLLLLRAVVVEEIQVPHQDMLPFPKAPSAKFD